MIHSKKLENVVTLIIKVNISLSFTFGFSSALYGFRFWLGQL